ncbi:MAG: tetratricopeptide repeat protein [Armatimonadota bacterium]
MLQELRSIDRMISEGDLTGAQDVCRSLLQEYPTSAAAHEKMGDIMYRRELWEDAIEWYELARQLSDTPELRAKLEDTRRRMREARTGPEPAVIVDTGRTRRLIWLGVGAAAMILVVVLAVIGLVRSRQAEQAVRERIVTDYERGGLRSPGLTAPSPASPAPSVAPSPAITGARAREIPQATANPEQSWAATGGTRLAPRRALTSRTRQESITEPLTDHDRKVIDAVSSLTWGDERSMVGRVAAMVDPYTGYAVVRVTIPSSLPRTGLLERVVQQAYRVALATVQADEVVMSLTIQMVRVTDRGDRVLAFRGNTTREALAHVGTASPDFNTLWNTVFKTVWWNPEADGSAPVVVEQQGPAAG